MDREKAKALLPIIQAFAEGKAIEGRASDGSWFEASNPSFDNAPDRYRIKPEPTYRPFANAEEMFPHRNRWVKDKNSNEFSTIRWFRDDVVAIGGRPGNPYQEAFEKFTFDDGTPFGVKVE